MPPLRERQHAQASFRGPLRSCQAPPARTGEGRRSTDPDPVTVPGRAVRAAGAPQSIDKLVDEWAHADPDRTEARQQAASMIQLCRTEKHTHLNLSGLELGTLPDCLDRLALRELIVADCRLQSLPLLPPTLTTLSVRQNRLTGLPPLPRGLVKLDATANRLQRLQCMPARLEHLAIGGNQLTVLRDVPKGLTYLDLSSNFFKRLPELPATLRYLNLSNNLPMDLHGLPSTLGELEICHMRLLSVPALPPGLTKLSARDNDLIELCDLPPGLTHLNVSGNRLHALPALPATMSHLIARSNRLRQLPALPESLIKLDVSHHALTSLPPSIKTVRSLSHIDLCLNQIPGAELAAFVGTMRSLGKNMSCIHFDRVQQAPLHLDAASPSNAIQGPSPNPHPDELAGQPPQERPAPLRRKRAQRVTDTVDTQANQVDDLPQAQAPATIFAVEESESPRAARDKATTAGGLDDWHLVEGLSEWEEIHPEDLQRPDAN